VKELWHDLLEGECPIRVWDAPSSCRWEDLGTPGDFARSVREEMTLRGMANWIDPFAQVAPSATILDGSAVEFGACVEEHATVENAILLPGAVVKAGETVRGILRNFGGDLGFDS
jgi:hypothetical protein